jgi:chaperonin GroES
MATSSAVTTITPLHDRVLIRVQKSEETTKSGIIIPESVAKDKPRQGAVVAVGKGKLSDDGKRIPFDIKVGDQVLFGKYGGNELKIDGEEYVIAREEEIYGVIV